MQNLINLVANAGDDLQREAQRRRRHEGILEHDARVNDIPDLVESDVSDNEDMPGDHARRIRDEGNFQGPRGR